MRRPIKWNIVFLGFALLVIGIMITIFTNIWNEGLVELNPVGIVLILSSFVPIA
jgi:uncharacterized membrane protein